VAEIPGDGFFMPFFKEQLAINASNGESHRSFIIDISEKSEVNGMEPGSKHSPDPDGRHRSIVTEWKPGFCPVTLKIKM